MPTTGSGPYTTARTYGKKSGNKRKQPSEILSPEAQKPPENPTKRRKGNSNETRTPSPPDDDAGTDLEESTPTKVKALITYGSPRKQKSPPPSNALPKPPKPVRDLSRIFDSITPSASPSASPTKLAKRMLGRSKTESSIESLSPTHDGRVDRTPSLPTFPSSPARPMEGSSSTPRTSSPLLPLVGPASKPITTRTYAGKFRSFLVALPASSSSNNQSQRHDVEDEEGKTRESYSSLRSRWGVDNSEDDPYPSYVTPSPTKSNSTISEASPSRKGKGKSTSLPIRPAPLPTGMMNPLKSISELRNKGESRRFLDEVGYLFEGLDKKGGIGLRRASALEIATKLCDAEFARKAKAADFFTRTWDLFIEAGAGQGEDKILDALLVFYLALVARDASSLSELAERPSVITPSIPTSSKKIDDDSDCALVTILLGILSTITPETDLIVLGANPSKQDIDFKKAGITKKDRTILVSIYKVLSSKSNIFYPETKVSMPLLICFVLQTLSADLISSKHLKIVLSSLRLTFSPNPTSTLALTLPLNWPNIAESLPYECLYYHLRMLDTYLLGQWGASSVYEGSQNVVDADEKALADEELALAREIWLAEDLIALGVCIEHQGPDDDSDCFPLQKGMNTILRLLVSLTHSDEEWGRKVVQCDLTMGFLMRTIHSSGREIQASKSHSVKEEEDLDVKNEPGSSDEHVDLPLDRTDSQALDTLCLALGFLTNLVQNVDDAKQAVGDIRLCPSCTLKKAKCLKKCGCSQPTSGLEILVRLYVQQQIPIQSSTALADSPEAQAEAEASFLRGHLAVLFGLLMKENLENQSAILKALPSPSSVSNQTKVKGTDRLKLSRFVDAAKDFVAFYTAVSNKLGHGEKESKVAKEVVRFLELQRDSLS